MAVTEYRAERPLGLQLVARGLGMSIGTLSSRRSRGGKGGMPEPDGFLGETTTPWWYESTIIEWGKSVGLIPADCPEDWDAVTAAKAVTRRVKG